MSVQETEWCAFFLPHSTPMSVYWHVDQAWPPWSRSSEPLLRTKTRTLLSILCTHVVTNTPSCWRSYWMAGPVTGTSQCCMLSAEPVRRVWLLILVASGESRVICTLLINNRCILQWFLLYGQYYLYLGKTDRSVIRTCTCIQTSRRSITYWYIASGESWVISTPSHQP